MSFKKECKNISFKQKWKNIRDKESKRRKARLKLPEGITHDMLPEYVWYRKECYNKEKQLFREFFRIERHPIHVQKFNDSSNSLYRKPMCSSNSSKSTILEKLEQIKEILYNLENNIEIVDDDNDPFLKSYFTIENIPCHFAHISEDYCTQFGLWLQTIFPLFVRTAPHLIFDRRMGGKEFHLIMKMNPDKTTKEELERFKENIRRKCDISPYFPL